MEPETEKFSVSMYENTQGDYTDEQENIAETFRGEHRTRGTHEVRLLHNCILNIQI